MYRTPSINLASIMLTKDIKLVNNIKDGKQYIFEFEDSKEREKIIIDYINGDLDLNIKDFLKNKRTLANIINS